MGSLALLYLAANVPEVESLIHVRFVLGPDGFMTGSTLGLVLVWIAGPAAAAVSGWLFAARTVQREPLAGAWMGVATFVLTLLAASLVPDLTRAIDGQAPWGQSLFEAFVGAPIMAFVASFVLAPLLLCCLVDGVAWAWAVRRLTGTPVAAPSASGWLASFGSPALVILGIIVGVGWLIIGLGLGLLTRLNGQPID